MSTRKEIVSGFYARSDEDGRLRRSRHGQLEYATTMAYIHRYTDCRSSVLEVGAGTGRYSVALAREGMHVTAMELAESNLEILKENGRGIGNLEAYQGDATDLSRFADDSFDATLLLGPMYHLYEPEEVHSAIDEAIRVTKPGGAILFAFISVYAIMYANYLSGSWAAGRKTLRRITGSDISRNSCLPGTTWRSLSNCSTENRWSGLRRQGRTAFWNLLRNARTF